MLDLKNMDFTIHKFRTLCEVVASNYPTITMSEYFEGSKPNKFILMRHDVDRMPGHALETAKIEHELGIRSTYYFRAIKNTFKPDIMKQIEAMDHEVGYHYEDLSVANGDHEKAIQLFASNLKKFREVCDIRTICMHGRPLSKHDNRDMWKKNDFKDFGLKGETYLSAGSDLNYFSDTGRTWSQKNSLRDFMPNKTEKLIADTTDSLNDLIKAGDVNNFYILTHPERWSINANDWSFYYGMDMTVNIVKKGLRAVRG